MRVYNVNYVNTTTAIFDDSLNPLGNNSLPYLRTDEEISIPIQILNSADLTNKYTGFTGIIISGTATIDNNWNWFLSSILNSGLTGAITEISVTYTGTGYVNSIGSIIIINTAGESETVDYTAYTVVESIYTFTVSKTLTYTYLTSDTAKIQEVPLARATSVDMTNKDTGLITVAIDGKSLRYFSEIEGTSAISTCRFELLIRNVSADIIYSIAFDFICLNIQDYTGAIPSPADPSGYYTSIEVDALLAGYMEKLAVFTEDALMTFDAVGQVQETDHRIEGEFLIMPITNTDGFAKLWIEKHGTFTVLKSEEI